MLNVMKWVGAAAVIGFLAGSATAADTLAAGKVKSVNADNKEFVLTDSAGKDFTFKLADNVVINRGGKESPSDLKADDAVSVCYDKGLRTWTANYILVKEGDTKDCQLVQGKFKNYDADKKEFTFTDGLGKDWTNAMGESKVRLNMQDSKIEDVKIGDTVLAIVDQVGDKTTLKCVMARHGN
jgi:Cu/Ag efflux protein CusF